MSLLNGSGVLWWSQYHHSLVLDLVCNILAKLQTSVLLYIFLSHLHCIRNAMPAMIKNVTFQFLAEANLGGLGLT
jgi:hypothetical protein